MEKKQAYSSPHNTARCAYWHRTKYAGTGTQYSMAYLEGPRLVGPDPNDDIGTHVPSYEHLFLSISAITNTMTVTHLDLDPHRTSRTCASSPVHEHCCTCLTGVGSDPQGNNW